ncbi:Zinc finger, C2H2 type family protein [Trichomonas vaginalis G3]|uniref:Zinc finger, C2H2 type family protein n=2 Tax=Trichomonas vaginalis TaxID=5722 RepID=A2E6A3_TRIV3|nr:C2H2 zinc finger factor-like protein ZNF1 [Trichomonas vaginalis G3]APZ75152.1 ZNF1 [Trichomonas vaginalis]EAY11826.1 Zinc finger, C2H2 type family protein [Trichomonas vaginalis G3]KAI5534244.1 C2H2 zinc finger factor-like protein ZNF1 [Trichomonas vaginalis G3]|eukprot:XP_001324049.1 Zinc finger, C2H2 type family protein [Trichomonas vaginalis G3]
MGDTEEHQPSFLCDICGAKFLTQETLKAHIDSSHNKQRLYTCPECNRTFNRLYHLKRHVLIHANGQELLESITPDTNEVCKYCGKVFPKRYQLKAHIAEEHETEPIYECSVCKAKFKTNHILKQHFKKFHSDEKKKSYKCEHCGAEFDLMSQLVTHKHEQHPRPYICNECGAQFKRKSNLTEHMKRHQQPFTERKTFICPVEGCGKAFTRKSNLRTHMSSIHGGVLPHACTLCGKDFLYPSQLQKHMESAHSENHEEILDLGEEFFDSIQKDLQNK